MSTLSSALSHTPSAAAASWRWITVAAASLTLAVTAATWSPQATTGSNLPSAPGAVPTVSPLVAEVAAKDPARKIRVIARFLPGADIDGLIATAGGTIVHRLPIIDGVSAKLSAAGAMRLATEPGVRYISLDAAAKMSDEGSITYADTTWAGDTNAGRPTGKGVTVAVIDTGIAGDIAEFQSDDGTSRVIASAVLNSNATTATARVGPGTHVAGLIAGNGARRNDGLKGKYLGAAPDAQLVSIKVSDDQGNLTVGDVINGVQFAVTYKDAFNIRVVNMSLNSTVAESAATDPLDAAAEVAWMNGMVVVAAAGNRGNASDATSYAPANDPFVITVGAVDDEDTRNLSDDWMPSWSSVGRTQDGIKKPDVLAPGAHLISTLAPGSSYASECPSCVVDGSYLRLGGSSMAAALASGTIAQILQAKPSWTPNQVKAAVINNGRTISNNIGEIRVSRTLADSGSDSANSGATLSTMLPSMSDYATLGDWTRMSLSRMSLSRMSLSTNQPGDPLYASWSRMSLSCACSPTSDYYSADPNRMSLSRMSLSRMSLSTSYTK